MAPTIAASTVVAVDGEYCQYDGTATLRSSTRPTVPSATPRTPPSSGSTQRLPLSCSRTRKRVAQVTRGHPKTNRLLRQPRRLRPRQAVAQGEGGSMATKVDFTGDEWKAMQKGVTG